MKRPLAPPSLNELTRGLTPEVMRRLLRPLPSPLVNGHYLLNHRQTALLTHALKHPGEAYRVESHQRSHGVAYQTARTDLLGLADLGLLEQGRAGRAFVFIAPADLRQRIGGLAKRGLIQSPSASDKA